MNKKAAEILAKTQKKFGADSALSFSSHPLKVDVIPTGLYSVDFALGIGGFPRGRISEIYGPEASGKTTLCLYLVASAQREGGVVAFIDMEHSLDPVWATTSGVNLDDLIFAQPYSGEQGLELVEHFAREKVDLIVVDSVAALTPQKETEGDMGDASMGLQARLMSQAMRKLNAPVKNGNTALVFTNQTRQKIGVIYGNPETTPGGMALKFYTSIRVRTRVKAPIKEKGGRRVGNTIEIKVVKNKLSPPYTAADFDLIYGEPPDFIGNLANAAIDTDVVTRSGSWYSFDDEKLGQGATAVVAALKSNEKLKAEIEEKVKERIALGDFEDESE